MLSVDQLKLVEFHVLGSLLDSVLLGQNLLLELVDQGEIFRSRWPSVVHFLEFHELVVE